MSEVVTPGSSADVIDVGAVQVVLPDASFNGDEDVSAYGSLATASLAAGAVGDRSQGYTGDCPVPSVGTDVQIQRRQWRIMCRYRFGRGHRC